MFLLRLLKHLAILLLLSLPLQLVGIFLVPIGILFSRGSLKLPAAFKWFDSADAWVGRNTETFQGIVDQGSWARYKWLAFRNPCNYFGYAVLGFVANNPMEILKYTGEEVHGVGDSSGDGAGYRTVEIQDIVTGKTYYEYYYIRRLGQAHCFRFRMGYKIGNPKELGNGTAVEQVLVLQPYKSYTGI